MTTPLDSFKYEKSLRRLSEQASEDSNFSFKGRHHTKESKNKMRLSLKGKISPLKGKHISEEHKRKIGLVSKGRKHSKESKNKMREYWINKSIAEKKITREKKIANWRNKPEWYKQKVRKRFSIINRGRKGTYANKSFEEVLGKEKADIVKKKISESKIGKNNPMYNKYKEHSPVWKGGLSFKPYTPDFNIIFKEKIRERDRYTCQLCSIFEEDHLKLRKRKLSIHHIDYNKLNSFPQNCIALCLRCNTLINKDREIWTKHFQELLKKLYDYEYTEDQKILLDFKKEFMVKYVEKLI